MKNIRRVQEQRSRGEENHPCTLAPLHPCTDAPLHPCSPAPLHERGGERLLQLDAERLRSDFDRKPFVIGHALAHHPLFDLARLVELARNLPEECVEYNAGDIPVNMDPKQTPHTGLSVEETIRRIENCRSWMVLKFVEQTAEYRSLLDQCLDEVQTLTEPITPGMCRREGFIFITSPGSVTPYHLDPEHNFLLQIRGKKTVNIFDMEDRSLLSEEELENRINAKHRNMVFREEFQEKAEVFELTPGMGLHFPVTAPHWVKNGDEVSISFSITFRTSASERRSCVHTFNSYMRSRGLSPRPFGRSRLRDSTKYFAFRAVRRVRRLMGAL
ncbi:MAG: cupin-like domain-containing protein [Blastocatellia bacterium]|nr:cupin-like domain-containing protein [Blastocatellia bacterium]